MCDAFSLRSIAVSDPGVKLWLVDVTPDARRLEAAEPLLAPDEIARADRFYHRRDRARFVLARAALRALLGEAVGAPPLALSFAQGQFGRPALVGHNGPSFNVSHSGAFALVGLAARRTIGVDIEEMRENVDELDLARLFFCEDEYRALAALRDGARCDAFYRIWTAKEAVLKAFGVGIAEYLKAFAVTLAAPDPGSAALALTGLAPRPDGGAFAAKLVGVTLASIEAPHGYAAALALV